MQPCICSPKRLLSTPKEVVVHEQRLHPLVVIFSGRGHDCDGRDLLAAKDLVVQILSRLQEPTHPAWTMLAQREYCYEGELAIVDII